MAPVPRIYAIAIRGAANTTERGRSRPGAPHSPAKTLELSTPDNAPIDIFVKTFRVRMENPRRATENGGWEKGTPEIQRRTRRYNITAVTEMVRIDPPPVSHFPRCSPRRLTANTAPRK